LGKTKLKIDDGDTIEVELHQADRLGGMLGRTPEMRRLMATIERAAMTDASVLVLGETGTGKEVVARAIHSGSRRSEAPFMTVDCGSLLPTLVASELFGHERGAFTGAEQQHIGAFERADGGTLFLDEIGELPAPLQATLLGALERRSFRRVGGTKSVQIDVRVVAATNRDLREEVNRGSFRADLYYRLAVLSLKLPPLRERTDDIPLLLENFLREQGYAGEVEALIPREVMEPLKQYRWPGNVRELRNFVDAALAMGVAPRLEGELSSTPGLVAEVSLRNLTTENYHETRDRVLSAFEKLYLPHLLERTRGNVALASREANMDRSYLIQLLKKHGLK
jgi:DNA-binding NtrC family response regulator